ncbi:MAG: class I SAM-dependent methyltransferase, partial [Candidatus Dormibacteria bacterium]
FVAHDSPGAGRSRRRRGGSLGGLGLAGREAFELFGGAADLYHRRRPRYPVVLFDRLTEIAGLGDGDTVLEVGVGTGIATQELIRRGLLVTGLEPSPEMAAVAQVGLGTTGRHRLVTSTFEDWVPDQVGFSAVISAQAWHWVDPEARYRKAAGILAPGGWLGLIWNRPTGGEARMRVRLDTVYATLAPELASLPPGELDLDRREEIAGTGLFQEPRLECFAFEVRYSARAYAELMATQSDHRRLPASR